MTLAYTKAPLPFVGQKRMFLNHFRNNILSQIPDDGDGWTIVDVFGGSGLLANNAKAHLPKATVIYNDYDRYAERLNHIDDINRLRGILFEITKDVPRQKRIPDDIKARILQAIDDFDGYVDVRSVSTWLLFSGKQISSIDELPKHEMYNTVRIADYPSADGYLQDLVITHDSFDVLIAKYTHDPKAVLLLDPPYLCTRQNAYAMTGYFGMTKFLRLMSLVRPPYVFFSSTKSELLDYMDYVQDCDKQAWQRLGGFSRVDIEAHVNNTAKYTDHMLYRLK